MRLFPDMRIGEIGYVLREHKRTIDVARRNNRVVGFCHYYYRRKLYTVWLDYIGVLPEMQKLGIGRTLVERLEREALRKGFHAIGLAVRRRNHSAITFYEKQGYIRNHADENRYGYCKQINGEHSIVRSKCHHEVLRHSLFVRTYSLLRKIYWSAVYILLVRIRLFMKPR